MPGGADNLTVAVYVYGSLHNIELAICDFPKKNGRQKVLNSWYQGRPLSESRYTGWENHIETHHSCRVADVWIWYLYLPISCHCLLSLSTTTFVSSTCHIRMH